jgi:hypothetical protein
VLPDFQARLQSVTGEASKLASSSGSPELTALVGDLTGQVDALSAAASSAMATAGMSSAAVDEALGDLLVCCAESTDLELWG